VQYHEVIGKIEVSDENGHQWHDEILDDGIDNLAKRCADDDAHRQINGVALDGELPEFFEKRTHDRLLRNMNEAGILAVWHPDVKDRVWREGADGLRYNARHFL